MKRMLAMAVMALMVAAGAGYAQEKMAAPEKKMAQAKTAMGTVKSVAADMLTVTGKDGKEWSFAIDSSTKVVARGGSHKTAESKESGKPMMITDMVKDGQSVVVKYHEMDGGKMHAAEVRVK